MDGREDLRFRIVGVLAGIVAVVPVGILALWVWETSPPFSSLGVVFGGITVGLIIATIAVADGQAWGALVIALYGAAASVRIWLDMAASGDLHAVEFLVLHGAISAISMCVAIALVIAHAPPEPR
jgi:hypothetical protein